MSSLKLTLKAWPVIAAATIGLCFLTQLVAGWFGVELKDLKALLFFTDGDGVYPEEPPRYETAFLFVNREDAETRVPPWAIPVLLDGDTLDQPEILYFA